MISYAFIVNLYLSLILSVIVLSGSTRWARSFHHWTKRPPCKFSWFHSWSVIKFLLDWEYHPTSERVHLLDEQQHLLTTVIIKEGKWQMTVCICEGMWLAQRQQVDWIIVMILTSNNIIKPVQLSFRHDSYFPPKWYWHKFEATPVFAAPIAVYCLAMCVPSSGEVYTLHFFLIPRQGVVHVLWLSENRKYINTAGEAVVFYLI